MATKLLEYTFNNTISDCIPQFIGLSSDGYTISDSVSDNITTRIINVNDGVSLPTRIWFADDSHPEGRSLLTLEYLNTSNINNMSMLFCYCNYLTSVNTIGWDISKVTDMTLMFFLTSNLQNLTLSNFDITNCTSFYRMFEKSGIVELNFIGNSTNSSVGKNMSKMFADCNRLTKLSISNIPNINNMSWMFSGCSKLESLNLIGLDTSNCTDFTGMFYGCSSLTSLDLSSFNTSKANSMQQMFIGCNKITSLDLSNFNTSKVTDMAHMFQNCSSLTSLDLSSFNTNNVTNMAYMFQDCRNLKSLDISNFNTSNSSLSFAFKNCKLEQIGMIYSDSTTINKVAENLYATSNCDIYYLDANLSELNPVNNVTYVQYKENVLYLPPTLTLRSNGDIHDEYNPFTSQFTQRIGEDGSVLDSPVITTVKSIVAYNDTVKYGYALPDKTTDLYHPEVESYEQVIDSTTLDGSENWTKVNQTTFTTPFTNAKSETSTEVFTMKDDVESINIVNDTLSLVFKETSYVATNNIAVNALKIWLQTNNVEFKYELKERIFTDMTLEEFDFDNAHFVKPQAYKGGAMTQSNKDDLIFAPITYQTKSNNRYELPLLDSNSEYTLHYEGSVNEVDLGGSTNSSVENNGLVQSGSSDKVVLFNDEVSNVMLIKGDVREQTIPYFQGLLSTESPVLQTMNDNIYDGDNTMELGAWNTDGTPVNTSNEIRCKNNYIPFPKGLKNADIMYIVLSDTTIDNNPNMYVYGHNKELLGVNNASVDSSCEYATAGMFNSGVLKVTINNASKCGYFSFRAISTNTDCKFALMVNKVGAYTDHKSSILSTPKDLELHGVGNVCDTLDCKTGKLTRKMTELVLDGSEDEKWGTMSVGRTGRICYALPKSFFTFKVSRNIKCNLFPISTDGTTHGKEVNCFIVHSDNTAHIQFNVPTTLAKNVTEFREWLSLNNVRVIGELPQETVETVDLDIEYKEGDKKYIVRTHDDVTHVNVTSEGLSPITEIGYITNEDNVETVTLEGEMVTLENAKANSVIQRAFMTGQTFINNVDLSKVSMTGNNNVTADGYIMAYGNGGWSNAFVGQREIKPNTKYLCIVDIVENTIDSGVFTYLSDYGATPTVFVVNEDHTVNAGETGIRTIVLTTKSSISENMNTFRSFLGASTTSGYVKYRAMVIEYREGMENWNIPYFKGLQSCKMPVLTTTGKNLFSFNMIDDVLASNSFVSNFTSEALTLQGNGRFANVSFNYSLEPNTKYVVGCHFNKIIGDIVEAERVIQIENTSSGTVRVQTTINDVDVSTSFTTPSDGNVKAIIYGTSEGKQEFYTEITNFYINKYESNNGFEPYKSNILSTPEDVELKSFDDLQDKLDLITGNFTEYVGSVMLDGTGDWQGYSCDKVNGRAIARLHLNDTESIVYDTRNKVLMSSELPTSYWITNRFETDTIFRWDSNLPVIGISLSLDKGVDTFDSFKKYLSENPIKVLYKRVNPIVEIIDLTLTKQNVPSEKMTYFKDYYGQLVSDGTLPKFTYRLESTNTYNVSQLKPNTLYTMYSEGEATVATLGGKASILLNNPQTLTSGTQNKSLTFDSPTSKVVLIEKDVTNQVVPYFTGTLDTVNPIIKTTSGNKSNTVSTNVCLRSVGDVCDTYDLNTGTLVKRVGEDHRVLDHPETSNIPVNTPLAYHGATVEMSSNELSLLPRFEYSCKSPNYYPLPVESNEVYTLKFDKTSNGTLTMGGVTANTTGNQTITTKNSDVQGVLFSGDLGIGNLMVMKTDVRNVPTPYFRGIQSVVNPTITVSNGDTQSNSVSLTLTMRSLPNGVKDELNLVTGEYIQRLDQRNFAEGDVNGRDMITDGTTTIYPLTVPRRSTLELNWSDGVLTAYDGTTNVTSEAELLKPHLFFQLATSTLEEVISQLKDENASLLETVATLEEDNLSTMVAVTEVFEAVLVMMPMTLSVNNDTKGGGSYMVEVYVTLILKGKKTLEQVPAVIRPQVEQMLKDVDAL